MNNDIQISAGLAIIQDNKILLEHPTNSPWFNSYSIPKGQMEPGENSIQTAIRETEEELGIVINPADILSTYCNEIKYTNKGVKYKKLQ
jgi:ADP-ribose pyrophosphatase YjhB (NUDIX family)